MRELPHYSKIAPGRYITFGEDTLRIGEPEFTRLDGTSFTVIEKEDKELILAIDHDGFDTPMVFVLTREERELLHSFLRQS